MKKLLEILKPFKRKSFVKLFNINSCYFRQAEKEKQRWIEQRESETEKKHKELLEKEARFKKIEEERKSLVSF